MAIFWFCHMCLETYEGECDRESICWKCRRVDIHKEEYANDYY